MSVAQKRSMAERELRDWRLWLIAGGAAAALGSQALHHLGWWAALAVPLLLAAGGVGTWAWLRRRPTGFAAEATNVLATHLPDARPPRVIAMLQQARAAGLDVRRDGVALVVRGPAGLERLARELLDHKPLVLATLGHEDDYVAHERSEHLGEHVGWRLTAEGSLVCEACHPAPGADPVGAPGEHGPGRRLEAPACPMCASTDGCQGRVVMPDGGWVCLAAVADGVLRNGRLHGPGRPPAAGAGR